MVLAHRYQGLTHEELADAVLGATGASELERTLAQAILDELHNDSEEIQRLDNCVSELEAAVEAGKKEIDDLRKVINEDKGLVEDINNLITNWKRKTS